MIVIAVASGCGWAGSPSGGDTTPSVAPAAASVAGYRVLEPGAFIAGFPVDPLDMESESLIERGWDLAIGAGGLDEVYVLDTFAKHVLRLDRDAKLQAVIGAPGSGPGEFENPHSIEADPRGGVWVADLQLGRLTRFDPDGHVLREMRMPALTRGFTVLPDGAVLYRSTESGTASLAVQSGDGVVDLEGELPPELAPDDFQALWTEYDLEFAVIAPDTVVALRNTDVRAYGAWRIALDIASARITDIAPIAFPGWLTEIIAADAEAIEPESREIDGREERRPGAVRSIIPFSRGVRMSLGDLWVVPHSAGHLALAMSIPLSAADTVSVVVRGDHQRPSGCIALDYAVVDGRLVELCMNQLRIHELLPSAPGPPPFAAGPDVTP
ncbi:SMP-30/gluconolactonase/LRE family protein [Candidatus Palauibacter sp.]|uniref:SMP-30/gluconolactonase/LRE family protein n=1 Tax=Candidatus Palauibacter sp. TaxID=3101350 RepID=UPI003B58EB70